VGAVRSWVSLWALVAGAMAGCGGAMAGEDAGLDAADAADGTLDRAAEGSPVCTPACTAGASCCDEGDAAVCVDTSTDDEHCGSCGIRCADGYGTVCRFGACVCGDLPFGCGGGPSICCPPEVSGGVDYCAATDSDGNNCGACGNVCDSRVTDRCLASDCVCGEERRPCAAGVEACCAAGEGLSACVDVATNARNCGGCDAACAFGERCDHAICTVGDGSCAGCAPGQICCHGACCSRSSCGDEGCGSG
jgi:hypothetical protein